MKLKLNVYPAVENLEERVAQIIEAAQKNRARLVEIAYGMASAETKRRILKILEKKEFRCLYHRLEKSQEAWGRIYLHFRWR